MYTHSHTCIWYIGKDTLYVKEYVQRSVSVYMYVHVHVCVLYTHTTAEPWMEASYSVYALFPRASIDHSRPQAININNVFKLQYHFYNNESLVFQIYGGV